MVANCKEVPLIVTLYKLAVPFKVLELIKVAVPAVAVKEPVTFRRFEMEKLVEVVIVPVTERPYRPTVPTAEIVLEVPFIIILPAVEEKAPPLLDVRLPVRVTSALAETDPEITRSFKVMSVPLIVVVVPDIVRTPPVWVNDPGLVVEILPEVEIAVTEVLTPEAVIDRLLKL